MRVISTHSELQRKEVRQHCYASDDQPQCSTSNPTFVSIGSDGPVSTSEDRDIHPGKKRRQCLPVPADSATGIQFFNPINVESKVTTSLLTLSREMRRNIFAYVIPVNDKVAPTYAQGMLQYGIHGPVYGDRNICQIENMDTALLRVNKDINNEVSKLLYGSNRYIFIDAHVWYWWLKRIGTTNINNIRSLVLELYSGWQMEGISDTIPCEEKIWSDSFQFLQYKHNIKNILITIVAWEDLDLRKNRQLWFIPVHEIQQVNDARQKALQNLKQLRGFHQVDLRQRKCRYMGIQTLNTMMLVMQQSKTPPPAPHPKLTLIEMIALIKHRRESEGGRHGTKRRINSLRRASQRSNAVTRYF